MWYTSQGDKCPVQYANWNVVISVEHNLATKKKVVFFLKKKKRFNPYSSNVENRVNF
jgi:hypothetical protein